MQCSAVAQVSTVKRADTDAHGNEPLRKVGQLFWKLNPNNDKFNRPFLVG